MVPGNFKYSEFGDDKNKAFIYQRIYPYSHFPDSEVIPPKMAILDTKKNWEFLRIQLIDCTIVINSPISRLLKGGSRALIPIPKHIPTITPAIVKSNSKFVFIHARHDALDTMI